MRNFTVYNQRDGYYTTSGWWMVAGFAMWLAIPLALMTIVALLT